MFLKKATAIALLALAPTLLAACGSSDGGDLAGTTVEDPSKPVPGGPGGVVEPPAEKPGEAQPAPVEPAVSKDEVTLLAYVQGLAPTRRVDLADMKDACRASTTCQADIAKFEAHLLTLCPTEADCKDPVGMLLYKTRSPQQVAQQLYSASFPQSKDVVPVVEAALEGTGDAGGDAGADKGAEPVAGADTYVDTLTQAVEDLKAQEGTPIDWVQIGDLIVKIDPVTGNAVTEQVNAAIEEVAAANPDLAETIEKLQAGEAVDAGAAAAIIEKVIDAAQP